MNIHADLLPSLRLQNRRNAERLDTQLPTCVFCGEINFPGVARCSSCCAPLYSRLGRGTSQAGEGSTQDVGMALSPCPRPTCPTCLVECDEDGVCVICGREKT